MSYPSFTKAARKNILAIIFVKAVIITSLVNFYMVSMMPDGTEVHSAPLSADRIGSILHNPYLPNVINVNPNASWACVRKTGASPDKTISSRRLGMRENIKRVHGGFKMDHHDAMIHYEPKRYEPKSRFDHYNPEQIGEIRRGGHSGECEMYSCINEDGEFVQTSAHNPGYAGKFVHRVKGVAKESMKRPGGKSWASGCVISQKYKFVYIHVLKSGGTATKEFIRKSLCGEDDKDCAHVNHQIVNPIGCKLAMKRYPDYFTFTFVRNPFSRMYSMYSMADGFPVSPSLRGHVTERMSFENFVRMTPIERKKFTKMHKSHYLPQTDFIFSRNNCPAFDFLGRVEHFDEDMRTILEYLNATEMLEYLDKNGVRPANTWGANKKKTIGDDLKSVYSSQEITTVTTNYKNDFSLLGYENNQVPSN